MGHVPFDFDACKHVFVWLFRTFAAYHGIHGEERNRYLAERQTAVANLYESLVREARAIRLARATGYRRAAWERIQEASRLDTPARDPENLRREAAA